MIEAEVLALFDSCSNLGRWGADDERGTLNYITPDKRLGALSLPRSGTVVSLGKDLVTRGSRETPPSALHAMTSLGPGEISAQDILFLSPHGFEVTHLDAIGHVNFRGKVYGMRSIEETFSTEGLRFASVAAASDGIVTRGVLLDVAASRGVDCLDRGDGVGLEDLEAAESASNATVGPGDAVFVRTGLGLRVARGGIDGPDLREGVLPEVIPWLHSRSVAVYAGDCIERLPSGYPSIPLPLHQVGMVSMGLYFLDEPDMEALARACRSEGRSDFLLIVAPLRILGGTASAVNPLAIF